MENSGKNANWAKKQAQPNLFDSSRDRAVSREPGTRETEINLEQTVNRSAEDVTDEMNSKDLVNGLRMRWSEVLDWIKKKKIY